MSPDTIELLTALFESHAHAAKEMRRHPNAVGALGLAISHDAQAEALHAELRQVDPMGVYRKREDR